jgi:predicted membrane protein
MMEKSYKLRFFIAVCYFVSSIIFITAFIRQSFNVYGLVFAICFMLLAVLDFVTGLKMKKAAKTAEKNNGKE